MGTNKKVDPKNPNIIYGDVDIEDPATWDKKEIKVRITTFLDEDVLDKLREEAAKQNKKYQTYLNEKLREVLLGEESVETRLRKLEEAVFKKSGA